VNIPIAASLLFAAAWPQFGHDPQHTGAVAVSGEPMLAVLASVVMDPFVSQETAATGDDLLVHYATPIVDGDDVFVVVKSGTFTPGDWSTQRWGVEALRWHAGRLQQRWVTMSEWKPVPHTGGGVGPAFEPVFQPVLANGYIYMPERGVGLARINRDTGAIVDFPGSLPTVLLNAYITSPLVTDAAGNIYFNVIFLANANPWTTDIVDAWIQRIAPDNSGKRAQYSAIVTGAPAATAGCRSSFSEDDLPWPPSQTAVPPDITCGSQRPGINVAPAIASDGTIYTVSRAHFNSRYSYLVALNQDLTPKWTQSLRDRFNDGCNVTLPQNATAGGCRGGAFTGVDPADNTMGAGRVIDDSSSSPLIAPDGSVFYGAYTRYNYTQGHLMHFSSTGTYLGSYPFGWDITPGIYAHSNTYSIITKENRYPVGTYCDDPTFCPLARPGAYFITALDPSLHVQWSLPAPKGFEWCINGPAIDANGVSYVNSEDGWLYSINSDGTLRQSIQLTTAIGQAYTPVVVDDQGRIYAEKAGTLFVVGGGQRKRAVRR
jgi:outer membrane protein assembly factor BamB